MSPELINLLQLLIDAMPSAKREVPQTLLTQLENQVPVPRWTEEKRAKQSKSLSEYWTKRRYQQPFRLEFRDGTIKDLFGWDAAAKIAGLKESTLRLKFSKSGGLRTQFFDHGTTSVVHITKLPYDKEAQND
jgi:hypothetical protein